MAAEYDRVLAPEVLYEVADLDYLPGVEAHGGLVENDDLRVAQQGLGYAHALAVALGEVLDEPVRDVAYLRDGHDALHLLSELGPAQALRVSDEGEIFPRRPVHVERRLLRQIAQQPLRRARILKDVVPVDLHLAGAGGEAAGHDVHGRGFPGPVRAEEAVDLPVLNVEREVRNGEMRAVALG